MQSAVKNVCFSNFNSGIAYAIAQTNRVLSLGQSVDAAINPDVFFAFICSKARESAVKRKIHVGSDDAIDDDKEEAEDEVLKDEFFQRIVAHINRRTQHAHKLSYANEVGSSLDLDVEDLGAWEDELHESESQALPRQEELTPEECEIMELQAYADECERQAALADFEDIPEAFWYDSDLDEGEIDAMDIS
ncbi:hypothetical protein ARMGADRAFT_1170667 [Armillaria gallica]|uniref:Uncharacterized protein n=1 Tax=Armillaria gallica TaxID=47427 RepID=A0A2H3CVC0_ARMGA|nr:hypothetical protein ARMGADRAFT_1170667 [Armillaria gallica]